MQPEPAQGYNNLGYDASGNFEAVGPDVQDLTVGAAVYYSGTVPSLSDRLLPGALKRRAALLVFSVVRRGRIEGFHMPTRKREKIQGRFKSALQAQGFLSVHDKAANLFRPRRHKMSAITYRQKRADAFRRWVGYASELSA